MLKLLGDVRTTGASRTDRGVHALGQVVSFTADRRYEPVDLAGRLNKMLPPDVAVVAAGEVKDRFSARFDAKTKLYRYTITLWKDPFGVRFSWWLPQLAQIDDAGAKLAKLSTLILGEHNFAPFSIARDLPQNPRCRISFATWRTDGEKLVFEIEGNRFLHKMVRSLVGAMVDVVRGRIEEEGFREMLFSGERVCEYNTAPPQGLVLVEVKYERALPWMPTNAAGR